MHVFWNKSKMSKQIYYQCKNCHKSASTSEGKKDIHRVKEKLCISCFIMEKYGKSEKDYLEDQYLKYELSTDKIAEELGVTQNAIRNLFKRLGIKPKNINYIRKTERECKIHLDLMHKGYKVEHASKKILTEERFEIINEPYPGFNLLNNGLTDLDGHCYDYLCKKEGKYFIIDVKNKYISNDRTKNYFYVTKSEIRTFDYYKNSQNIIVKLLVVVEQGELFLFKFFDWNDFIIPEGFIQGKYRNTVRVRLREDIDLPEFKIYNPKLPTNISTANSVNPHQKTAN